MTYLIIIFLLILIIGIVANLELGRDKKRIKRMLREYSYRTYCPEEEEEERHTEKKEDD